MSAIPRVSLRQCLFCLICLVPLAALATGARAETRGFSLRADQALVASGLMKHLVPRFALKTGIHVTLVEHGGDATLARSGSHPAISGTQGIYFITATSPYATRFADWLLSAIGQRTIAAFPPYTGAAGAKPSSGEAGFSGDKALGEKLALSRCGRCHVINKKNRYNGVGSTPSFGALRSLADWRTRFKAFFTLNPHPSFTQIKGITPPFPEDRPPHIAPILLTPDEFDAILAYVAVLPPADLGAPIQNQ